MNVSGRSGSRTFLSAPWIPLWWKIPPSPAARTFFSNATGFPRMCDHPLISAEPRTLGTWDSNGTVPKSRVVIWDPMSTRLGWDHSPSPCWLWDRGWLTSNPPLLSPQRDPSWSMAGECVPLWNPANELNFISTLGVFQLAYESHPGVLKTYLHWDNLLATHAWSMNYDGRWFESFLILNRGRAKPLFCLETLLSAWNLQPFGTSWLTGNWGAEGWEKCRFPNVSKPPTLNFYLLQSCSIRPAHQASLSLFIKG